MNRRTFISGMMVAWVTSPAIAKGISCHTRGNCQSTRPATAEENRRFVQTLLGMGATAIATISVIIWVASRGRD
jgi:hypothetical protein